MGGCDLEADPAAGIVAGDVSKPGAWQDAVAGAELLIHTAASVSLRMERSREVWQANVLGTANVVDAAQRAGVRRLVHFSSVSVFGVDFPA